MSKYNICRRKKNFRKVTQEVHEPDVESESQSQVRLVQLEIVCDFIPENARSSDDSQGETWHCEQEDDDHHTSQLDQTACYHCHHVCGSAVIIQNVLCDYTYIKISHWLLYISNRY